ncbi:MAG TPA: outer membrane protein assembly factor BamB [Burkholderiales bacterium]|nr:outer membrane protein assembly factor BamB [Burkholderiales bacterium]
MSRHAALVLLLPALAGCFGSAPAGPQPAELPALEPAREPRQLWSAAVGAAGAFAFQPALAGDSIYAASRNGAVARLEAAGGRERWRIALDAKLSGGVGADARTVVVASDRGEVFALEAADGKLRWRARVSSEVLAAPRVHGDLVLVRSADSRVYAMGAEDGKRRWAYQRAPSALMVRSPAGMVPQADTLYVGFAGGRLVALALSNGGLRWEAAVAQPRGATELERVADVVGDPVVIGREVCAAAFQGRVACFDAQNGSQLWARELSSVTGVSADARTAYVSDDRGAVHALDRSNGRSLWKQDRLAHRQLSLPVPLGEQIAVGDLQGYVHLLSRDTGAFVGRAGTDGSPVRAAPLPLPEGFLVQTQRGGLFALAP